MSDCSAMSSLLGFCVLFTISFVYTLGIQCYNCNSEGDTRCEIDGIRLIAELNSTFLHPCHDTLSVCALSYEMTVPRSLIIRSCAHMNARDSSELDPTPLVDPHKNRANAAGYQCVLLINRRNSHTWRRLCYCEFTGCNYKNPESEPEQRTSCYNCSSTASDYSCGFVLSAERADQVLTVCPASHLCLSSFRLDKSSLARFDFNRSCVSETEVTQLKRVYGNELVGHAADSSDQIQYFVCDSPGCNDVFPGSNVTSISCFVCSESTTICNDVDGRMLGTEAGKSLLRPCPSEEPHHCSVMIFYDSKKELVTRITRQCMLTRLVWVYQQSGGDFPVIKTSDPNETFYMSFCRTTGCNRAYGRLDLLPKSATTQEPLSVSMAADQIENLMQKSNTEHIISNMSLITLLIPLALFVLSGILNG